MSEPTNWKFSLLYTATMTIGGAYVLVIVAMTTSGSGDPNVWLRVIATWGASSSGHVPWSAPLLVTSVGALAALSNSPLAKDEVLGFALTLSAQGIAVGAALWMLTALAGATVPGIISDASERSQLWGVVLVAGPVILGAALFAGRFKTVSPEIRIAFAQKAIPVLDRELNETRWRVHELWSITRARCHAWIPLLIVWGVGTGLLIGNPSTRETTPTGSVVLAVVVFSMVWGAYALALGLLRVTLNQPTGRIWRRGRRIARRPTALGLWIIIFSSAFGGLSVFSSVALTAAFLLDSESATVGGSLRVVCILIGGMAAISVVMLSNRRGKNAWATIGYRLRARRRESLLTQLREAQAEQDSYRRELRSLRALRVLLRKNRETGTV